MWSWESWIIYDQFREIWTAAQWTIGGRVPLAGGGAAGLDVASPLTAWIYALALATTSSEVVAAAVPNIVAISGVLAIGWHLRGTSHGWLVLLLLASPVRWMDLRASMDQMFTVGLGGWFYVWAERHNWRFGSKLWIAGIGLGLLPHTHASGLIIAAGLVLRMYRVRGKEVWREFVVLGSIAAVFCVYWLVSPEPVDHHRRGFPYARSLGELLAILRHVFEGFWALDAALANVVDYSREAIGVARIVHISVVGLVLSVFVARKTVLEPLFALLVLLVLIGRTDYILVTQHLMYSLLVLILAPSVPLVHLQGLVRKGFHASVGFAVIVLFGLTAQLQAMATETGTMRLPATYYMANDPVVWGGSSPLYMEVPTAKIRNTYSSISTPDLKPRFWDQAVLMGPSGFAHYDDLGDPNVIAATTGAMKSMVAVEGLGAGAIVTDQILSLHRDTRQGNQPIRCYSSYFVSKMFCPMCAAALAQIPATDRREGLFITCTNRDNPARSRLQSYGEFPAGRGVNALPRLKLTKTEIFDQARKNRRSR